MKKILFLLVLFFVLFSAPILRAEALKGGVSEEYIPKGFFGSWGVISKLDAANNPAAFNSESRDVWMLSGYSNTLVLENLESGASSEITIEDKSIDGRTLKFARSKEVQEAQGKIIYRETVEFKLLGNNFSGTDKFAVEHYDKNGKFVYKDEAIYLIAGVRISGTN